jgi:hypothetical protein
MLPKSFLGNRRNDKAARTNSPEPLSANDVVLSEAKDLHAHV